MSDSFKKSQPIGIFDSGVGGLTVANAIRSHLPNERFVYFGDTAHLPYGDKSADAIRFYSIKISKFLIEQGCKMIVIACSSASSAAYDVLLDFYSDRISFVNVVDPLIETAVNKSYKNIGLIGTKATVNSNIYKKRLQYLNPELNLSQLATPLFAPMIEEGYCDNTISESIISEYLSNNKLKDINCLLLACTHYPLIKQSIESYYDGSVDILDATDVVARSVYQKLYSQNLLSETPASEHKFYVSDLTDSFKETTQLFYGEEIDLELASIW